MAELKVVLVDDGSTADQIINEPRQGSPPAGPPAPAPQGAPQPSATPTATTPAQPGEAADTQSGEAIQAATTTTVGALQSLANSLGVGGLMTTATNTATALRDLYNAAQRAAGMGKESAAPATPQTPATSPAMPSTTTPAPQASNQSPSLPSLPAPRSGAMPKPSTGAAPPVRPPAPVAAGAAAGAGVRAGAGAAASSASVASAGGAAAGAGTGAALAGLAAAAGPAAIAVGAVAVAAAGTAIVLKSLHDAFKTEAERLEGLSPEISAASAQADLRAEMADMRRAQQIGPQLGNFTDDMSRMQTAMADLWTQVLKILLDIYEAVRPLIDLATKGVESAAIMLEVISEGFTMIGDYWTMSREELQQHINNINGMQDRLARVWTRDEELDEDWANDPFMAMFLGAANGGALRRGQMPRDMGGRGGPAPMGV